MHWAIAIGYVRFCTRLKANGFFSRQLFQPRIELSVRIHFSWLDKNPVRLFVRGLGYCHFKCNFLSRRQMELVPSYTQRRRDFKQGTGEGKSSAYPGNGNFIGTIRIKYQTSTLKLLVSYWLFFYIKKKYITRPEIQS